jgi:cysteinyl-tRNA synthetase
MEKAARREGITVWVVAQKYIDATFGKNYKKVEQFEDDGDFGKMNILKPHFLPRATEFVEEQIEIIQELEKRGFTYKTEQAVYFDISKFPKYEEIVGQSFEEMRKGERANTTDTERNHPADFRLWQLDQPDHQMQWDSPWGKGFPGWHIECSAMSSKLLGQPFDIHTGGEDHIRMHHPSEMAQSESAYDRPMANYWLHNAFITVDGQRMGKSLGNAFTLSDVIKKGFDPMDLRYLYLQAHYRTKQNFTWDNLESAKKARLKLITWLKGMEGKGKILSEWKEKFIKAIEDDLNTPQALAVMWELIKSTKSDRDKVTTILNFDKVLGLRLEEFIKEVTKIDSIDEEEIVRLVKEREDARRNKDWDKADEIRDTLMKQYNVEVKDSGDGSEWSVV